MLELWIVRHGETTRNRDGRLAGWADVRLTAAGRAQAEALRPLLAGVRFDGVWCSPLTRARMTARLAWGGRPVLDPRLREIDFGALEGQRWHAVAAEHRDALLAWRGFSPPGGESLEQLEARVHGFVAERARGRHLVFTHGGVMRLLSRAAGEDRFMPCGTLLVLDWSAARVQRIWPERTS